MKYILLLYEEVLKLPQYAFEQHRHPIPPELPRTNQDVLTFPLLLFQKLQRKNFSNISLNLIGNIRFKLLDSKDKERDGDFSTTDSRFCCSCASFAFLA